MHRYALYLLTLLLASLTAACIGNDRRPLLPPAPTLPSAEDARARYYRILADGQTALWTSSVGYYRDGDARRYAEPRICEGDTCAEAFTLEGVGLHLLGDDRGIPRVNESGTFARTADDGETYDCRIRVYGGWMEHSFFAVQANQYHTPDDNAYGLTTVVGYAVGTASRTNPDTATLSATWNGLMLGIEAGDWPERGDVLTGDATVALEMSDGAMQADVSFTNIVDGVHAPRPDMAWTGLTVEDGRFTHAGGAEGLDMLVGEFFGPDHGEVAGTFERKSVLGAFGGMRE